MVRGAKTLNGERSRGKSRSSAERTSEYERPSSGTRRARDTRKRRGIEFLHTSTNTMIVFYLHTKYTASFFSIRIIRCPIWLQFHLGMICWHVLTDEFVDWLETQEDSSDQDRRIVGLISDRSRRIGTVLEQELYDVVLLWVAPGLEVDGNIEHRRILV